MISKAKKGTIRSLPIASIGGKRVQVGVDYRRGSPKNKR